MKKEIEIDLDVYRFIESSRQDFDESHNTILRRLFGLEPSLENRLSPQFLNNIKYSRTSDLTEQTPESSPANDVVSFFKKRFSSRIAANNAAGLDDWSYGKVSLPQGTRLRKWYRGQKYEAEIRNGSILFNGTYYQSPSSAAMALTGAGNVNGWEFWEYFDENSRRWLKLKKLRK
ncbi:MAG: DUF2924 domain-containing protein [Bacteroidia bacterium]|nr:DUF2924 domain-containing protein [Bacteroidia bacterium]